MNGFNRRAERMSKQIVGVLLGIVLLFSASLCLAERLDFAEMEAAEDVQLLIEKDWTYPIPYELLKTSEYIVLANQDHLLGSDYVPEDLVKLTVKKISSDPILMRQAASDALTRMFDAAKEDGITLYAHSGYRSYQTQNTMYYNRLKKNNGKDDGVVAYPGSSDHQTGLGIDVINKAGIGKKFTKAFANTKEGTWIAEHCWDYGFIIRYQQEKEAITKIIYEPWHLRYVGIQVAQYMHERGICLEEFTEEWEKAVLEYEQ